MFTITAKGTYGLLAMVELARYFDQGPRQIRDIAEAHAIPQHYLEQILVSLKKAGLVESYRGAQGGYSLAKAPGQTFLLDILTQLEGKLEIVPDQRKNTILSFFWDDLELVITKYLHRTLEDLLVDVDKNQSSVFYSI